MSERTILIVDDSPEDRFTFRRYLTRGGREAYRLLEAASGREALRVIEQESPDCILLDFHLPDMDGLALLSRLKNGDALPRFPVLVLTGSGSTDIAVRAMKQGVQDYLMKGTLTEEILVRAIEHAIEKQSLHRQLETQRGELRRRNDELEAANEALQIRAAVLENMAEGVVMADQEGVIRFTNAAFDFMFGYRPDELIGQHVSAINDLPVGENGRVLSSLLPSLYTTGRWNGEIHSRTKAGVSFVTSTHISLLEFGEKTYWIAVEEDITQSKLHQQEIIDLNARLHRAVFEGSHRIKNHLQTLGALVDIQLMDEREHIPVDAFRRVRHQIGALSAIHDLMTLSTKADAENDLIPMKPLLEQVLPMLQHSAGNLRLRFDVEEALLPARHASALVLILNEFVSNGVKHGKGEVEVAFRAGEHTALLEVCDTGQGFPLGFDCRRDANTGLDLVAAIVRTDLGGQVSYGNREAGGGRVTVTFPMPADTRQAAI